MTKGKKINIILVTGFLGSGKTTLINRLIDYYESKKIALIINDFGKIAVDGTVLNERPGENLKSSIYEIANGSIFCSFRSSELVKVLQNIVDKEPEVILIETSGLSDPSAFRKILFENSLQNYYHIEKSICVVDSTTLVKLYHTITAIGKQIRSSNIILINKSDLIEDDEYGKIKELVKINNETVLILKTKYSDFDLSVLRKNKSKEMFKENVNSSNVNNRISSLLLEQKELTLNEIENFFSSIVKHIFRVKGFLKIGKHSYYVSDKNGELKIERINRIKIANYGVSVLLPEEYESSIKKAWQII